MILIVCKSVIVRTVWHNFNKLIFNYMKTLTGYFIAVAIALVFLLCLMFFINNGVNFKRTAIFVTGYVVGMLALYIKMKWFLN